MTVVAKRDPEGDDPRHGVVDAVEIADDADDYVWLDVDEAKRLRDAIESALVDLRRKDQEGSGLAVAGRRPGRYHPGVDDRHEAEFYAGRIVVETAGDQVVLQLGGDLIGRDRIDLEVGAAADLVQQLAEALAELAARD